MAPAAIPGKIVITQGQLESMLESFTQTRQRPPTEDEWEGLIRDRVREEVYYREALALGLDKDDLIIRRRLQQKMEFISDDVAAQAQPTDARTEVRICRRTPTRFAWTHGSRSARCFSTRKSTAKTLHATPRNCWRS